MNWKKLNNGDRIIFKRSPSWSGMSSYIQYYPPFGYELIVKDVTEGAHTSCRYENWFIGVFRGSFYGGGELFDFPEGYRYIKET